MPTSNTSGPPAPGIAISSSSSFSHRYASNARNTLPSPADSFAATPRSATPSMPMSIPLSRRDSPPPPLPPPKNLEQFGVGVEQQQQSSPREDWSAVTHGIKPGSSLLGGHLRRSYSGTERHIELDRDGLRESASNASALLSPRILQQQPQHSQHQPGTAQVESPGHRSSRSDLHDNLTSERQLSGRSLDISRQAYDQSILSKIGSRTSSPPSRVSPVTTQGEFSGSEQSALHRLNGQARPPVALPERRHSSIDESLPRLPSANGAQPGAALSPGRSAVRSPLSDSGESFNKSRHWGDMASASAAEPNAPQGSSKPKEDTNSPSGSGDEHSQASKPGALKRRAVSPPPHPETVDPNLRGAGEPWPRSHHAQMQKTQHPSSLASSASSRAPHAGSLGSSYQSSNPSTAPTSYQSEQPFSPAVRTKFESPSRQEAYPENPAASSHPLPAQPQSQPPQPQPSQQQSQPPQQQQMQGQPHGSMPPPLAHRRPQSSGVQRAPGLWICDCCPKKPKKFENEEDLRIHEMEKQYVCQYCNNRFKNKNEAERHQNSLHLRRHSWSCAALTSFESAFHPTPQSNTNAAMNQPQGYPSTAPSATDTCGYCGQEFHNPPNWDDRVGHLNHVHKFGECNQNKKFFRADHFRQHLKHSHSGASGKWTNVLETACMKDEPMPQPIHHGMHPGMPPQMHAGPSMQQGMPQHLHQGMPQHMPPGMQHGMPPQMQHSMQQGPPMASMGGHQQQYPPPGQNQDLSRLNEAPNER